MAGSEELEFKGKRKKRKKLNPRELVELQFGGGIKKDPSPKRIQLNVLILKGHGSKRG